MAARKTFNCSVVFLTTISHVVWGLCIHYDCGMSEASCFSEHVAGHAQHDDHDSPSERIHSDSGHPNDGSGFQQSRLFTFVIPCCHGDRHEESPHQHGLQCVGNCSVYLPKLPHERQTDLLDCSVASCPSVLETPAGLYDILAAQRTTGSGDFRSKKPLHPLLTVLLL
jgi:hypothetical protein